MQLIYEKSKNPVRTGDIVHLDNSTPYVVVDIIEPHKPASTGRVVIQSMCERKYTSQYFPGVIGAMWINRTDQ
jgi:hypothetical protein